jgi:hypothetical protein
MPELRVFVYPANVDEAFKQAAKQSLIEAKWIPLGEPQMMVCTGSDRRTCNPLPPGQQQYMIVAQRT